MAASASAKNPMHKRKPSLRAKTSGWTAFVEKERQKQQGIEIQLESDPFPPISLSNTLSTEPSYETKNTCTTLEKPFSSVILPSPNFPSLEQNIGSKNNQLSVGHVNSSQLNVASEKGDDVDLHKKIKKLYSWADEGLIKDVMAGVNYEFDQAIMLLGAMVSLDQTLVLHEDSESEKPETSEEKHIKSEHAKEDVSFGEDMNVEDFNNDTNKHLNASSTDLVNAAIGVFRFVPIEPELWEEDDVYSLQRKDALRMMRSAARHSKSASDAYLRGDHLTAHYFSAKAQEEWLAAGELNTKAAKEILSIRNSKNDEWTLDLHGLHSTEAVEALEKHLKRIECRVSFDHSIYPREVRAKHGFESTLNPGYSNCLDRESSAKRLQQPPKQRPSILQVITGKGNHSRGEAALPIAIRSFLAENGYRYDETRPGVIAVRPKFRPQDSKRVIVN
ncbi:unnamed protein product [Cuscuta epithymum]|uniref:Smr domain-containing protein n=2 Tax=Cuscuta epithymum TaxID=186058 RepID=A0AAV0G6I2_9ASTE|nr:unnamed protein product [Cuscuta epithymum]